MKGDVKGTERSAYMSGEGALLYTDVGRTIADEIAGTFPDRISVSDSVVSFVSRSENHLTPILAPVTLPLYALSERMCLRLREDYRIRLDDTTKKQKLIANLGSIITDDDLQKGRKNAYYAHGFDDPDFAVHFSSWSVDAVMRALFDHSEDALQALKSNIQLTDLADVISTGWFSETMHSLAFADFGRWGSRGRNISHYMGEPYVSGLGAPLLEVVKKTADDMNYEDYDGKLIVQATTEAKVALRHKMRAQGDSVGCPAARNSIGLESSSTLDPHALKLVKLGVAIIKGDDEHKKRLVLTETAIDSTLIAWAHYLRRYVYFHGEPKCDANGKISHQLPVASLLDDYLVL